MRTGIRRIIARVAPLARFRRNAELQRLLRRRRFSPTTTRLLGPELHVPDGPSFVAMHRGIFIDQIYRFTGRADGVIIDGGANIGLSVIYFRRHFPDARIIAFEADPRIFDVLQKNLAAAGVAGVDARNQALSDADGTLEFESQGADGGRVRVGDARDGQVVRVPAVRLSPLLDQPVELLKLDIEGSETAVLRECAARLVNVRRLFVEYHSFSGQTQTLHEVFAILHNAGFRVHIQVENGSPRPFVERIVLGGMDLQLNIFAYREGDGIERVV